MRQGDCRSQLRDFLDLLMDSDLARITNPVVQIPEKLNGRDVTAVTTSKYKVSEPTGGADGGEEIEFFFSLQNYIQSIRNGDFSALLFDGSLLQIRYDFEGGDLVGHRLCYFPVPCILDQDLIDDGDFAEAVELTVESEPEKIRLRSPLRFDFSKYSKEFEPEVHLHFIRDEGRLPIFGPLSLAHFVRLVFSTFYQDQWHSISFLKNYKPKLLRKTIAVHHEFDVHLSCRHTA